jgi:hypothetical protein
VEPQPTASQGISGEDPRPVQGRGSFSQRTGQRWRENVEGVILLVGLVLATMGLVSDTSYGKRIGISVSVGISCFYIGSVAPLLALIWQCWTIRCPQCQAKVWWRYFSAPTFFRKNTLNPDRYGCSSCGYRPE